MSFGDGGLGDAQLEESAGSRPPCRRAVRDAQRAFRATELPGPRNAYPRSGCSPPGPRRRRPPWRGRRARFADDQAVAAAEDARQLVQHLRGRAPSARGCTALYPIRPSRPACGSAGPPLRGRAAPARPLLTPCQVERLACTHSRPIRPRSGLKTNPLRTPAPPAGRTPPPAGPGNAVRPPSRGREGRRPRDGRRTPALATAHPAGLKSGPARRVRLSQIPASRTAQAKTECRR